MDEITEGLEEGTEGLEEPEARLQESGLEPGAAARIVLADDRADVRSGLRELLDAESGLEVVAEAGDMDAVADLLREHHPDVLVLALNTLGGSSLEAIAEIRDEHPEIRIVVMTVQEEPALARRTLGAGALGYVLDRDAGEELVAAVRRAAVWEGYVNPQVGARLAAEPSPADRDELTPRELEVLGLIALGHTNAEVAGQLGLSLRTVETHRSHIQRKLGLSTRAELVAYARERGLASR